VTSVVNTIVSASLPAGQPPDGPSVFAARIASISVQLVSSTTIVSARVACGKIRSAATRMNAAWVGDLIVGAATGQTLIMALSPLAVDLQVLYTPTSTESAGA